MFRCQCCSIMKCLEYLNRKNQSVTCYLAADNNRRTQDVYVRQNYSSPLPSPTHPYIATDNPHFYQRRNLSHVSSCLMHNITDNCEKRTKTAPRQYLYIGNLYLIVYQNHKLFLNLCDSDFYLKLYC